MISAVRQMADHDQHTDTPAVVDAPPVAGSVPVAPDAAFRSLVGEVIAEHRSGQRSRPLIKRNEKAAVLGWHLAENHALPDGNKRTAFTAMIVFPAPQWSHLANTRPG